MPREVDEGSFLLNLVFGGIFAGGVIGCTGCCLLIGLVGSVLDGLYKMRNAGDAVVAIGLFLAFAGMMFLAWRVFWLPLWFEGLAVREQSADKLRRGLFLTPDAMVIRVQTNYCDIIPREAIAGIGRTSGRVNEWYVVYRVSPDTRRTYHLSFAPFSGRPRKRVEINRIRKWAGLPEEDTPTP